MLQRGDHRRWQPYDSSVFRSGMQTLATSNSSLSRQIYCYFISMKYFCKDILYLETLFLASAGNFIISIYCANHGFSVPWLRAYTTLQSTNQHQGTSIESIQYTRVPMHPANNNIIKPVCRIPPLGRHPACRGTLHNTYSNKLPLPAVSATILAQPEPSPPIISSHVSELTS